MTLTTALLIPDHSEMQTMTEMAKILAESGMIPEIYIRKPGAIFAIMQKGRELSIPPMYALNNISVIKGKATANSELMLALIYRDHGDRAIHFKHTDADSCTIEYRRRDGKTGTLTYTMEEAVAAGHPTGQNSVTWRKYPANMLRARCISAVARMAFPDSIGGMYTPEELDARVDDEGNVLPVEQQIREKYDAVKVDNEVTYAPSVNEPADVLIAREVVDDSDEPISKGLSRKLWAVAKGHGWDEDALRAHVARNYPNAKNEEGAPSAKGLTQGEARAILEHIERVDELATYADQNDWAADELVAFIIEQFPVLKQYEIGPLFVMNSEEYSAIREKVMI